MQTLATFALALTLAPLLPGRLSAQAPRRAIVRAPALTASVGDRIRLSRFGGSPRAGKLLARTNDSLLVKWLYGSEERVPVFEVGKLEVSRGRRRHMIGGTVVGLGVGTALGLLLKNVRDHDMGADQPRNSNLVPVSVAGGTALGFLVGAMGTERWQAAPIAGAETRVGLVKPARGRGVGLALSAAW